MNKQVFQMALSKAMYSILLHQQVSNEICLSVLCVDIGILKKKESITDLALCHRQVVCVDPTFGFHMLPNLLQVPRPTVYPTSLARSRCTLSPELHTGGSSS